MKDSAGVHLFLDGFAERHVNTSNVVTERRYYMLGSTMVASCSKAGTDAATVEFYLGDIRGSTSVSVTRGTATNNVAFYDPYGNPRGATSIGSTEKGYIGQYEDTATGLNYLNNRYYDPQLGIFLSFDPLVDKTGDPYLYAAGNPTTLSDPTGLDPACQGHNATEGLRRIGSTYYQYGVRVSVPGQGCTQRCDARAVGRTQFDFFVAALRCYWNDNHDGTGAASDGFWSRSSVKLSGIDLGGGPSLSLPGVTEWEARGDVVRDRPTREIRGDSGWKLDMIDNDNSPARHVWGFVATSRTWGDNAAKAGLAQTSNPIAQVHLAKTRGPGTRRSRSDP
jgi:RHS repeat-associated protein